MDGKVFAADVYSVLAAFEVDCPARQHAIKKLLMPGQRGAKSTVQDLDEALVSVSRAIDMVRARLPEGGTLTGETEVEPEPMPEPEPKPEPEPESDPKLVTSWQECVRNHPWKIDDNPKHCYPIETEPESEPMVETEPELEPEPKPKMVTWRRCVRIQPWEVDERTLYVKWYRSGDIPEDWYPIEAQSQPVETVKQLSEAWEP